MEGGGPRLIVEAVVIQSAPIHVVQFRYPDLVADRQPETQLSVQTFPPAVRHSNQWMIG